MTTFAPQILHALATIRHAVRTSHPQQLGLLYYSLLSLAGDALAGVSTITVYGGAIELGHSVEVSQGGADTTASETRVHDRWISPQECASRLNISLRTLRRRAPRPPYSSFCIRQEHGFKVSELGLDDFMRRARR